MIVSVEVPVIRGGWLIQCIDSVLQQTSPNWVLSLRWDEGDSFSREIMEALQAARHPRIQVHFGQRQGIARARQFLSERSRGDLILPLDDDDILEPDAVARLLSAAVERPWAGIIRARRRFIDDEGLPIEIDDWFPFERRSYLDGATLDVANHSQPYAIRREMFLNAGGWRGFEDWEYFGEDCSAFTIIEERAEVELLDAILYCYRIHGSRTSLRFPQRGANDLWRRIADEAVSRRHANVRRTNDEPPFHYVSIPIPPATAADIDVVIPFWESNECEVVYGPARPLDSGSSGQRILDVRTHFSQTCDPPLGPFDRLEIALAGTGAVRGMVSVALFASPSSFTPARVLRQSLESTTPFSFDVVALFDTQQVRIEEPISRLEITFEPFGPSEQFVILHTVFREGREQALMRFFRHKPNHCRELLDRCLASLRASGIGESSIHVIEKRQSSSKNRNEAFRACSKPWICFMDDDAELVHPNTLQQLLDACRQTGASLCGPKLLTGARRIYSGVPFTDPIAMETRVAGMGEADGGQHDVLAMVPWLPSTVLLTHRSVMLATGGFDELYEGSQHEDADFCLRARARGFRCCYNGHAVAVHHNALRNSRLSSNAAHFVRRWQDRKDLFLPISSAVPPLVARQLANGGSR
jgi:GT2 family glycosyltransferase